MEEAVRFRQEAAEHRMEEAEDPAVAVVVVPRILRNAAR
jgi:hypothetical protein